MSLVKLLLLCVALAVPARSMACVSPVPVSLETVLERTELVVRGRVISQRTLVEDLKNSPEVSDLHKQDGRRAMTVPAPDLPDVPKKGTYRVQSMLLDIQVDQALRGVSPDVLTVVIGPIFEDEAVLLWQQTDIAGERIFLVRLHDDEMRNSGHPVTGSATYGLPSLRSYGGVCQSIDQVAALAVDSPEGLEVTRLIADGAVFKPSPKVVEKEPSPREKVRVSKGLPQGNGLKVRRLP